MGALSSLTVFDEPPPDGVAEVVAGELNDVVGAAADLASLALAKWNMYNKTALAMGFSAASSSSLPWSVSKPLRRGPTIVASKSSSSLASIDNVPTDSTPLAVR